MKTYTDLTAGQQEAAVEKAMSELLQGVLEDSIRFNDGRNGDDLQARIDAACQKANMMQTPWFAHEYIMDTCREDIRGMALCAAEDALYPERHEHVMLGIASS